MADRGLTEGPMPDDLDDMDNLVQCCRAAAALQPDSTAQPAQTCQVRQAPGCTPGWSLLHCFCIGHPSQGLRDRFENLGKPGCASVLVFVAVR